MPADEAVCSITVTEGLINQVEKGNETYEVMNPKTFSLATNTLIPVKEAYRGQGSESPIETGGAAKAFGIASMALESSDLQTRHTICITREGANVEEDFLFTPIHKNAPTGLWGESLTPDLNGEQFIENALSGFQLTAKKERTPDETLPIDRRHFQFSTLPAPQTYSWNTIALFEASTKDDAARRSEIENTVETNPTRDSLLEDMGFDPSTEVAVDSELADAFTIAPLVKA